MALDILSAPGESSKYFIPINNTNCCLVAASTDVERAFSRGGLIVNKCCHSLSDASVWASTVLSSWGACSDLIPESDILTLFANKSKHSKKAKKARTGDVGTTVDTDNTVAPTEFDVIMIE